MFRSGRGGENGEDQKPPLAGVAYSVGYAFGRDQHDSGFHGEGTILQDEDPRALEDVVDLVHAFVGVELVLLAGFKGVEPDHDPGRREEGALAHLLFGVDGVFLGANGFGMIHSREPTTTSAQDPAIAVQPGLGMDRRISAQSWTL